MEFYTSLGARLAAKHLSGAGTASVRKFLIQIKEEEILLFFPLL